MNTAKLLNGDLFQDSSLIAYQFKDKIIEYYVEPRHLPFLTLYLIHPDDGRLIQNEEVLDSNVIYYLLFEYSSVLPWVDSDKLELSLLTKLPEAIRHIELNLDQIDIGELCDNVAAGDILWSYRDTPDIFNWELLSKNPCDKALSLMRLHNDRIIWNELCKNVSVGKLVDILEKNLDKLNWELLSGNPGALSFILNYPHNIVWTEISSNPAAIPILKENPQLVNLHSLCSNPMGIGLLIESIDSFYPVDWLLISKNPMVHYFMDTLSDEQLNKLDWRELSRNRNVQEYLLRYPHKVDLYRYSYNTHPDMVESMRAFSRNKKNSTVRMGYSIPGLLSNPSAIEFIKDQLSNLTVLAPLLPEHAYSNTSVDYIGKEQWLDYSERTRTSIWTFLTYNTSIYCPLL